MRNDLVVIDHFSKFGWTFLLKNKNVQIIIDSFENIPITSKRKPNLIETDDGREFVSKIFTDIFQKKNNIKRYSRYTAHGVVFAKRFNRTIRDVPKKLVLLKGDGNWVDVLP